MNRFLYSFRLERLKFCSLGLLSVIADWVSFAYFFFFLNYCFAELCILSIAKVFQ